jgi:hypothetical protein
LKLQLGLIGSWVGELLGDKVGKEVGERLGKLEGIAEGVALGPSDGTKDSVGVEDGRMEGLNEGCLVGTGDTVGPTVGIWLGKAVTISSLATISIMEGIRAPVAARTTAANMIEQSIPLGMPFNNEHLVLSPFFLEEGGHKSPTISSPLATLSCPSGCFKLSMLIKGTVSISLA